MIYAPSVRNNDPLSMQMERFPPLRSGGTNASLHTGPRKCLGRREKRALLSSSQVFPCSQEQEHPSTAVGRVSHPETSLHYSRYLSLFPVGLSAQIPQKAAGKRRLPPTSVPKPRMDPPPPTSAPSPPEEPPGLLV